VKREPPNLGKIWRKDLLKKYNSLYIVSDFKTESSRVLVSLPEGEEEKGHLDV
jgi:hypothetical protein